MPRPESFAPVAITSRSGLDESVHFGAVVALGTTGEIEFAIGDPAAIVFPRSSNKPMQAVAMVRAGLSLPPDLLALVCASHDGTPMHTDGALRILTTAGLDEAALANTASLPLDAASAEAVLRAGGPRTPLLMNCSGKHSGMLATCVHNGWSHDPSYLDVEHPLQLAITDAIDELCAEPHAHIGVDGCGAPAHAMSLVGLAR
ncbi:MAG: asparaginase, partial [Ilumatobacteraceae bacterium]